MGIITRVVRERLIPARLVHHDEMMDARDEIIRVVDRLVKAVP